MPVKTREDIIRETAQIVKATVVTAAIEVRPNSITVLQPYQKHSDQIQFYSKEEAEKLKQAAIEIIKEPGSEYLVAEAEAKRLRKQAFDFRVIKITLPSALGRVAPPSGEEEAELFRYEQAAQVSEAKKDVILNKKLEEKGLQGRDRNAVIELLENSLYQYEIQQAIGKPQFITAPNTSLPASKEATHVPVR